MENISKEQVENAIRNFLTEQYDKKTEKEQKHLATGTLGLEETTKVNALLTEMKNKYSLEVWMEDAANRLSKQLYFGTHLSKGIHPDAKGDNINFIGCGNAAHIGTQSVISSLLDANGNAAALPLAAFFDYSVTEKIKIRHLINEKHHSVKGAFSSDTNKSDEYQMAFYSALNDELKEPATHERNKQLLWPISLEQNSYVNIIPLYPSVLTHEFYLKINGLRYSDENKQARDNRFKKNVEQHIYMSLPNMAAVQLGGTKPQNISSLMSKQGGRNYLLPSLPPSYQQQSIVRISPHAASLFDKVLDYRCKDIFSALVNLIKAKYNNVNIRDARKSILDNLLFQVLAVASTLQQEKPAGWSKDYKLDYSEKLWLDPYRAELEGEEKFASDREQQEWRVDISHRFAHWVNNRLKKELPLIKDDLADAEHQEWKNEMRDMIAETQRAGQGVFL